MKTVQILEQISQTLTFLPGVEPITSLVLQALLIGAVIDYLSGTYIPDKKIKIFTPTGIVVVGTLVAVDYWTYKGYEATTYIGSVIQSNADLMAFFLGLWLIVRYVEWDFPDKWGSFKKVVGA